MDKQYTIGEVANMFKLQSSTLRYYEEIGILTNVKRTSSGKRIYEQKHINRLKTICCFKHTGMSIANLQEFFKYEQDETAHISNILQLLAKHQEHIKQQLTQLEHDYAHLNRKLAYYSDIKTALDTNKPLPDWQDYKQK